jgi:hypothetical protein
MGNGHEQVRNVDTSSDSSNAQEESFVFSSRDINDYDSGEEDCGSWKEGSQN